MRRHWATMARTWRESSVPASRMRKRPPVRATTTRTACVRTSIFTISACLRRTLKDTEFAIIAALQYIRYINERNSFIAVHGANLSLSIRHDVRNYRLRAHAGLQRMRAAGGERRGRSRCSRQPWLSELRNQGRAVRKLRGVQHHRPGQRRRRDHGRRHSPVSGRTRMA